MHIKPEMCMFIVRKLDILLQELKQPFSQFTTCIYKKQPQYQNTILQKVRQQRKLFCPSDFFNQTLPQLNKKNCKLIAQSECQFIISSQIFGHIYFFQFPSKNFLYSSG
eukprot:TRINITY_DN3709_c0_g1_i11.p2 TRINITY_DN3709_c0_g1~~TRINITY_DN3709_c0_g1_i11.p2  ORF type:complete len:109 (-),score=0.35 TRINITY_DN3709_c0_g1_i11:37-363(-)